MSTKKLFITAMATFLFAGCVETNKLIDTSQTFVPEEGGITFVKLTNEDNEQLIVPTIGYDGNRLTWWANPYFAISNDGAKYAYIGSHNGHNNIFMVHPLNG